MTERNPIHVKNLDIYGNAALPWSRARALLAVSPAGTDASFFLGTVRPDGRPHAAGIGALWHDDAFFLVSGPTTQKSRNLAHNPNCTLSVHLQGLDLVMEGTATRITNPQTLEQAAELFRRSGWPAEVKDDAFTAPYSAPSAGTPPWWVYRFTIHTAYGVATAEPYGATRWRFE